MLGDLSFVARSLRQSLIGDLLNEAKDLRDKGEFDGARQKVRAVLSLDATHIEANRLLSKIYAELHRLSPFTKPKK